MEGGYKIKLAPLFNNKKTPEIPHRTTHHPTLTEEEQPRPEGVCGWVCAN